MHTVPKAAPATGVGEGNERRKTLRAALKERSPAAGRAGIPSPVPEARASSPDKRCFPRFDRADTPDLR